MVISPDFLRWPRNSSALAFEEMEAVARTMGVTSQFFSAPGPNDFEQAFAAMVQARMDALTVATSTEFWLEPIG